MNNALYSIAYVSSATRMLSTESLQNMLQEARGRNEAVGLTGLLLHSSGNFMQVMEGPEAQVQETFARIKASGQHHQIIELMAEPIERREFEQWSMAYSQVSAEQFVNLQSEIPSTGRELLQEFWRGAR